MRTEEHEQRIKLSDTGISAITKLVDGNPGAIRALTELMKYRDAENPSGNGGFFAMLNIDSAGIYGPDLWLLYKDVCDHDIKKMSNVLKLYEMGTLSGRGILEVIRNRDRRVFELESYKELE